MRKRTFRSPSQIKHHLEAQRNCGVSVSEYCKLNRIKISTFFSWRKKYKEEPGIKVAQFAQIIPVQLNTVAPLEIISGSISVMVRSSCDEQTLLAVLKAVKQVNMEHEGDQKCY